MSLIVDGLLVQGCAVRSLLIIEVVGIVLTYTIRQTEHERIDLSENAGELELSVWCVVWVQRVFVGEVTTTKRCQ